MDQKIKYIRIATVPVSLKFLLRGQGKYMKSQGFESYLASADGEEVDDIVDFEGCQHLVVPMTRAISPIQDLKCLIILIRTFWRIKPDIVHSHTPKAGMLGMIAAWICGVRVRVHTLAGWRLLNETGMRRRILYLVEKITFKLSHEVWPNSKSLYQLIEQSKFSPKTKLRLIGKGSSNGIDLEEFSNENLDKQIISEIKSRINYHDGNIYLLTVGRIVVEKGIEELISGFVKLKERHPNLRLILVGPREDEIDPISESAREMIKHNSEIVEIGFSNLVKYYMEVCDILIHPSHREGFPNVPLQSGAMKCPIICSNIGGNIDIVSNNKTGLLFEVRNEEEMIEKIEFGINHLDELKTMASRLKSEIEDNFSRTYVHQQMHSEYLKLLNQS